MQDLLASPAYPKPLPTPTIRKGSLTYEIRVRVPPNAQGGRFKGSHTSRSLMTRDKAEALKRLPRVYDDLQGEFDAEATRHSEQATKAVVAEPPTTAEPALAVLSVDDACQRYRDHILKESEMGGKSAVKASNVRRCTPPARPGGRLLRLTPSPSLPSSSALCNAAWKPQPLRA